MIEVRHTLGTSRFKVDNEGKLELPPNANSVETHETFIECCMHMLRCLPRQHLLAVHISRNMVTFIGVDRIACTVSIPFDYVKEPRKLLTFFYRFATSNREFLGYGPSMVPLSQEKNLSLYQSLPSFGNPERLICDDKAICDTFSDVVTHKTSFIRSIYEVTVTDPDRSQHDPLVSQPCTDLPSLYGRGGKGYIVFDISRDDFVFFNDSQCPETGTITLKSAVYEELRDKCLAVEDYVATVHCGGEVPGRDGTGVQRIQSQKRLSKRKLGRIHCRLVLNEIAHHMSNHGDAYGLITVVLCALCGKF